MQKIHRSSLQTSRNATSSTEEVDRVVYVSGGTSGTYGNRAKLVNNLLL